MQDIFDEVLERFIQTGLAIEQRHNIPFIFKDDMVELSKCKNCKEVEHLYYQKLKSDAYGTDIDIPEIEHNVSTDIQSIKLQILNTAISLHREKLNEALEVI